MKLRLLEHFARRASDAPGRLALRQIESPAAPERAVTRGELARWVRALSARLAQSVAPGGVVLVSAPNQPEFTAAFLAVLAAGLRAFPVSPELAQPELISAAKRSNAAAVIGTDSSIESLRDVVQLALRLDDLPGLSDVAAYPERSHATGGLLLLSSGTTGQPKIVFR